MRENGHLESQTQSRIVFYNFGCPLARPRQPAGVGRRLEQPDVEIHSWEGLEKAQPRQLCGAPLSDIVFFDTHDILTIFQFDAIYRDIFTIFSKRKLGQNAPKFHSWSAYIEIFATKWLIYRIFMIKHHTLGFFLY